MKVIEKRYSFLFEDVWFILLQYMYFEKFVIYNTTYLAQDENYLQVHLSEPDKSYRLMFFNSIFTALTGLGGLTTIPYCLKIIKQRNIKIRIFYILTFIQILLQTIFPFMRAVLLILQVNTGNIHISNIDLLLDYVMKHCTLVGFQACFYRVYLLLKIN